MYPEHIDKITWNYRKLNKTQQNKTRKILKALGNFGYHIQGKQQQQDQCVNFTHNQINVK